jgi:2,4-dienoyl-CoA reductase-like NADH-dependent reductase (Old Yellow Enzyme family)
MSTIVPLRRESAAEKRMRARLANAAAPIKAANEKLVGELVAAMTEAILAGVDGAQAAALTIVTINEITQAYAAAAMRARDELRLLCDRVEGEAP